MESNNNNNENLINTDIILEKLKAGEINLNNDTNISERNNNIFIQKNNINSNFSNNNNNQFQINNNIQNNKNINNNSEPFFPKNNQMNNNIFNNFNNMNNNFLNNFSNQNNFNNNNFQINNNINQFNNGFNNNANNNNLNQFSNNPHNQISFNNPQIPNNFMNNNNIFNINFAKNNNPIQFNNNLNMNFMQLNQNSNLNNNIINNNNFNNFNIPFQNPQNKIINNMFNLPNNNLQNQNNTLELQNRRSNSNKRYFRCQKCNNIMEENLKKDHMFSHQIEENERRRNNYSPNFQINRNHRRVRDNINIRNRPLDRRNVEIRIHTSNNNRNNNNNDHNRIRREELVYHARPFNRFIPIFLNDNRNNKGKLTFPEIIIEDINKLDDANKSCTICLEEFKSKEKVTALPCFHYFHTNCINKWLEKKKFCPVCKFELTKENLDKKMKNIYH